MEIKPYKPSSEKPETLLLQANIFAEALMGDFPDNNVRLAAREAYVVLPRGVVFLKAVDNFLELCDLGMEIEARTIYAEVIAKKMPPTETQVVHQDPSFSQTSSE